MLNRSNELLSSIVAFRTYAKFLSHLSRRESLEETINRNMQMHLERFGGMSKSLSKDIIKTFGYVHDLKAMPSMRGMQFAGEAVKKNNTRQYNCSFLNIDDIRCFSEVLFLLLSGVGVGYSVQKKHISKLPKIQNYREEGIYTIHDSIIGWADAVERLFEAYMLGRIRPVFDFSKIRPKGSYLITTGAKAPGPEPLKKMLEHVESKLKNARGRRLSSLEVHDIICIISDCVLAGGIRRAALISLFDRDDNEMLTCKSGEWWNKHPYRARANNSAILPRDISKKEFKEIFKVTQESGSGEPGFSWSNNLDMGFNPSLRAGTRVWTKEFGMVFIEELENKHFTVKGYNGDLCSAKCWLSSPKAKLIKVTLENNFTYYATSEHKWAVLNKNGYEKVTTDKLVPGMKLPRLKEQDIISYGEKGTYDEGKIVGYFYGDGWITDRKDTGKRQYSVVVPNNVERKSEYLSIFKSLYEADGCTRSHGTEFNSTSKKINEFFSKFGVDKKELGLPEFIFREASNQFINGFIQGYFDADGCTSENRHSISSKYKKLVKDFQDLLGFKGRYYSLTDKDFNNYIDANGKRYEKDFTRYTLRRQLSKIGTESEVKIKSVEKTNLEEPVWDISVNDSDHCFQLSGVITGNCHEISLNSNQFCNLTTINITGVDSKQDFLKRCHTVALLGTLQAAYTDFPYLRPSWKETTEREALLGCSMTGIADNGGKLPASWLKEGAKLIMELNEKYAKKIGINPTARCTTIKPEGSSSCVLGSSSGIHDRHAKYYFRRIRMNKDDALYKYLETAIPDLCEDDIFSPSGGVVTIPQESPEGSINRHDTKSIDLLKRAMFFNRNWILPGHRSGDNKNNVSLTVSVRESEWEEVSEFMYENRNLYSGISLLPFDGGTYTQAPFEDIDEKTFKKYNSMVGDIDLKNVMEDGDYTNKTETIACSGGKCDIV